MSAIVVVGTKLEVARKLDTFWDSLCSEDQAALHTAFNVVNRRPGYETLRNPEEILRNAVSGRHTISSVRGDFFRFVEARIHECSTAEEMLGAILTWGDLSPEEQESKFLL